MATIVIKSALAPDTSSFQSDSAKMIRDAIDRKVQDFGGKVELSTVTQGVLTLVIDKSDVADKILAELKKRGKDASTVDDLDAAFETVDRKEAAKAKKTGT
jgi:hypothetical protein